MFPPSVDVARGPGALLQRAAAAPRAVTRATRRWGHAAGLTANIAAALRSLERLEGAGVDADPERLAFQRWLAGNVCAIHGIEVDVCGRVDLLASAEPMAVIANHISYLDPIAILSRLPAFAIAKREVASWPLLGQLATQLGMLPYSRGDAFDGARVLRQCASHLSRGFRVLAFPEGTTTRGRHVEGFHRGFFHLVRQCNVALLPLVLRYDCEDAPWVGDETFLPHYMRTSMRPITKVVIEVLNPLRPEPGLTAQRFSERVHRQYRALLSC